jgi:hypothetical protein
MTIQIYWQAILADIRQTTSRLGGEFRIQDAQVDDTDNYVGITDALSLDTVALRWTTEAIARTNTLLQPKLHLPLTPIATIATIDTIDPIAPIPPTTPATDNLPDTAPAYWLLKLADTIPADPQTIATLIHRFIVSYVLKRWCETYCPDDVSTYAQETDNHESHLLQTVFAPAKPRKHHFHPIPDIYTPPTLEFTTPEPEPEPEPEPTPDPDPEPTPDPQNP